MSISPIDVRHQTTEEAPKTPSSINEEKYTEAYDLQTTEKQK